MEKEKKTSKLKGKGDTFKSGRNMMAENCADAIVPWPHHSVFAGPRMVGALYD